MMDKQSKFLSFALTFLVISCSPAWSQHLEGKRRIARPQERGTAPASKAEAAQSGPATMPELDLKDHQPLNAEQVPDIVDITLSTPRGPHGLPEKPDATFSTDTARPLADHNVIVLIDRSGSMETQDCPDGLTRWQWCREQTLKLTREAADYLKQGITVVAFADESEVYEQTTMDRVKTIFDGLYPRGGTRTAEALQACLEQYFQNRNFESKPLVVAVITDGCPNDQKKLCNLIAKASQNIAKPSEITLTFLQVGSDPMGRAWLSQLDQGLDQDGAKFDIVSTMDFDQLQKFGLTGALVKALRTNQERALPVSDAHASDAKARSGDDWRW